MNKCDDKRINGSGPVFILHRLFKRLCFVIQNDELCAIEGGKIKKYLRNLIVPKTVNNASYKISSIINYSYALFVLIVILGQVSTNTAYAADPGYEVTKLGSYFIPEAIDDTPIVLGGAKLDPRVPDSWTPFGEAYGVNTKGQMTGSLAGVATRVNYFRFGVEVTNLGSLPGGGNSVGLGINDAGDVVGYAISEAGVERAFLYDDVKEMQNLIPNKGVSSKATDVNNDNVVVGTYFNADGSYHAFYWSTGVLNEISQLANLNSVANAINNAGQFVGIYEIETGVMHAYLYDITTSTFTDLNYGTASASEAYDINEQGEIVGKFKILESNGGEYWHGFVIKENQIIDLNSLLPPDSNARLESGLAINNVGDIAGVASPLQCCGSGYGFSLSKRNTDPVIKYPEIIPATINSRDYFGTSVDIDGDIMVVGAPSTDVGGQEDAGMVYVYQLQNGYWALLQSLTAEQDSDAKESFGASVAISGMDIVVGASGPTGIANAGAVYVFKHEGNVWVRSQRLVGEVGVSEWGFGQSVDVDEDTIVVGWAAGGGDGRITIFSRQDNVWNKEIAYSGPELYNSIVKVDGDTIVTLTDRYYQSPLVLSIFVRNNLVWELAQRLTDGFNKVMDISGDSIAVSDCCGVRIYRKDDSIWKLQDRITSCARWVAHSISIDGDKLAFNTAEDFYSQGIDSFRLHLYEFNGMYWRETDELDIADMPYGTMRKTNPVNVVIADNSIVVGLPYRNSASLTNNGSVIAYSRCSPECPEIAQTDLSLSVVASPDPVPVFSNVTYHATVSNPNLAFEANPVFLKGNVSEGMVMLQDQSSQLCTAKTPTSFDCKINSILPGDNATLPLVFSTPPSVGALTMNVELLNFDVDMSNNSVTLETSVVFSENSFVELTTIEPGETITIIGDAPLAVGFNSNVWPEGFTEGQYHYRLYLDNVLVKTLEKKALVELELPTPSVSHSIKIDVVDFAGNVMASDVVDEFFVEILKPEISISKPSSGQTFRKTIDNQYLNGLVPTLVFSVANWELVQANHHLRLAIYEKVNGEYVEQAPPKYLFNVETIDLGYLGDGQYKVIIDLLDAKGGQTKYSSPAVEFTIKKVEPSIIIHWPENGLDYLVDLNGVMPVNVEIINWLEINGRQYVWLINGEEKGRHNDDEVINLSACDLKDGVNNLAIQLINELASPVGEPETVSFKVTKRMPVLTIISPSGQIAEAESYPLEVTSDMGEVACATLYWYLNDQRMGEYEEGSTSIKSTDLKPDDANTVQVKLFEIVDGVEEEIAVSEKVVFRVGADKPGNSDGGGMGGVFLLLMMLWGWRFKYFCYHK